MVGTKRTATRSSTRQRGGAAGSDGPDIYQEMLADAGVAAHEPATPERPLKRRKPGSAEKEKPPGVSRVAATGDEADDTDDDKELELEDVVLPTATVQTMERESDDEEDEDDDDDIQFEDVDFTSPFKDHDATTEQAQELHLNLTAQAATTPARDPKERRKPITREEKDRRIAIHKMHLVCLLSHVSRRNHWCNDARVQDALRPHLTDKVAAYLTPGSHLPQFGRAESLKNGLQQAASMWKAKFEVTERGLRRALWAGEVQHLEDVCVKIFPCDATV